MRVRDHLVGRAPELVAIYRDVVATVRRLGPVRLDPQGRGIVLQTRARAIGITLRHSWVDVRLWLKTPATHRLIAHIEDYGRLGKGYTFRLRRRDEMDADFRTYLASAYAVGAQTATARRAPIRRSARMSRR